MRESPTGKGGEVREIARPPYEASVNSVRVHRRQYSLRRSSPSPSPSPVTIAVAVAVAVSTARPRSAPPPRSHSRR